jgi:hypothetical protein
MNLGPKKFESDAGKGENENETVIFWMRMQARLCKTKKIAATCLQL